MKRSKGKFSSSHGDGTHMQSFGKYRRFNNFRGRGRDKKKRFYFPIRKDDMLVNKFISGRGMPRGKGHFVYPDTYEESTPEDNSKHVSVFHQIVKKKNKIKLTSTQRKRRNIQQMMVEQHALELFKIGEKYGLPNKNHLVPLEQYKGWNIINLLTLLSKVKVLADRSRNWLNSKIDELWRGKGVETPASWALDQLLQDLEPLVLKDSIDYVKVFLAKQCYKEITETVQENPKNYPGIFLREPQVLQHEATRLFRKKIDLSYEDFTSVVAPVVRHILLQISSEKVKKSWISIADSMKENPDLSPLCNKIVRVPLKRLVVANKSPDGK